MTASLAVSLLTVTTPTTGCRECPYGKCEFSVARVRFYLYVHRQARLAHEPFADVLRAETRNSRLIDPAVHGRYVNPENAASIGVALEAIARTYGLRYLHPANAEAVAKRLCPERYDEGTVDEDGVVTV